MMWPCFAETFVAGAIGALIITVIYSRRERLMRDAYLQQLDLILRGRKDNQ